MGNFFAELKRRHIYRVAAAYAVIAWLLLQIVNNVTPIMQSPTWVGQSCLLLLVIGFPLAIFFAWMRELPPSDAVAPMRATFTDWALIGVLFAVLAAVTYQQFAPTQATLAAAKQRGLDAAQAAAASNKASISIAVLPFANMSGDAAQEFFSDGMTEEITSALAKVPDLQVVGRTSAFQFKGEKKDLRAIGQALSATHLIEGSVRKAGNRVRITAQLIRADTGTHLWTDNYDRELTDVFAIQEDIAQAIAAALQVPLRLKQGESLVSNRTGDLDSYQQYLRARALYRARAINESIKVLEPVVARDPGFAPAWAQLARSYSLQPNFSPTMRSDPIEVARRSVESMRTKAEMAALEAIRLDAQYAGGYAGLAEVRLLAGKWSEAEDLFHQAFALDANDPDILFRYSALLNVVGRLKEGLAVAEQVRMLEPFVPGYQRNLAGLMQDDGQNQASIPILESIPADGALGYIRNVYLARAYAAAGAYAKSADTLLAITGNQVSRRSVEEAARLIRTAPIKEKTPEVQPTLEGELNFVYAYIGALDRVLEYPERAVAIGLWAQSPFDSAWYAPFAPIRKTERFKAFARNAGLIDYWRARGWPDLCRPAGADDFVCD